MKKNLYDPLHQHQILEWTPFYIYLLQSFFTRNHLFFSGSSPIDFPKIFLPPILTLTLLLYHVPFHVILVLQSPTFEPHLSVFSPCIVPFGFSSVYKSECLSLPESYLCLYLSGNPWTFSKFLESFHFSFPLLVVLHLSCFFFFFLYLHKVSK